MRRHVRFGIFLAPFHASTRTRCSRSSATSSSSSGSTGWTTTRPGSESTTPAASRSSPARDVHRGGGGAHPAYPVRDRGGLASLPPPVHDRGPHPAARLHDPRARDVRGGAGRAHRGCGQDGDPGRGAAPPDGRSGLRPRSSPSRRDGEPQDGLVRASRRLPSDGVLHQADGGDGGRLGALAGRGRGRPESTASVCSPSAARPTPASPRTPRTGRPARPSRPRTVTGRTAPAGGWSP